MTQREATWDLYIPWWQSHQHPDLGNESLSSRCMEVPFSRKHMVASHLLSRHQETQAAQLCSMRKLKTNSSPHLAAI